MMRSLFRRLLKWRQVGAGFVPLPAGPPGPDPSEQPAAVPKQDPRSASGTTHGTVLPGGVSIVQARSKETPPVDILGSPEDWPEC